MMTSRKLIAAGGTDAGSGRGGIAILEVVSGADEASRALVRRSWADVGSVGYIAADHDARLLYVASVRDAVPYLSVLRWSDAGELRVLSSERVPSGASHLTLTDDGAHLITAEYGAGRVGLFRLVDDGTRVARVDEYALEGAGPHSRQEASHPHQVLAADGSYIVPDLGTDHVHRFEVTGEGSLAHRHAWRLPPGSGPRHAIVHDGVLFVNAELSGELWWGRFSDEAHLDRRIATSESDSPKPAPSAIGVHRSHVLVANRGPGTILALVLSSDGKQVRDEFASGGAWPRDFDVVDDQLVVADLRDHCVRVVEIDSPHRIIAEAHLPGAACVVIL